MMNDKEIDEIIAWIRQKIKKEKSNPFNLSSKRMEGYEKAMHSVMSYLHSKKEENK